MSIPTRRRADATKNRERLISEARALFTASSGSASLEAIAQAAGVGIGTLYRHFPSREALVEAVYRSELAALETDADDLLGAHPSFEAMRRWMDRYARFVATKHAMHGALHSALTPRAGVTSEIRSRISTTIAKFISAGARDKTIRRDINPDDVALSLAGVVLAATTLGDKNQVRRVLDLLMDGLRPRD